MANHDELIQQFTSTTGESAGRAQFFLEMAGWDLKVAIDQFYEFGSGDSGSGNQTLDGGRSASPPATAAAAPAPSAAFSNPASSSSSSSKQASVKKSSSKVRTLSDLGGGDNDDDSDDNQHQNFFAGGEKSGMVVQGPNRDNDIVNQILKKAAERGSAPEELSPTSSKPNFFKGTGYKLGSEEEPSETIGTDAIEEDNSDLQPVTRYLTFWRNGFSVDDGALYRYDDPANQTMLTAINSGRAPLSLLNVRHGQPVDVRVARRQDEDYVAPPKAPPKPFEGAGHRLGSPLVASEGSSRASTPGAFPSAHTAAHSSSSSASGQAVTVDESQPTTQIQIRLGDGTRLVTKFNHTHTIGDIRRYIDANRSANGPYILQTTFPVKELKDDNATLKEAGLMNTVVVQRFQ